jgi:hypothetical protein
VGRASSDSFEQDLTDHIEIKIDHASLKVSDKLRLKAIRMKAKAEGITVDQFCQALSKETREYYQHKLFPTKLGPEKAYRDENGSWRMYDLSEDSQPYTLQSVLEANLYVHIRAYLMGLALSEEGQQGEGWKPETIILRNDNKIAIVKDGKLELHVSEDWVRLLEKKRKPTAESKEKHRRQ